MKTWSISCSRCQHAWIIKSTNRPGGTKVRCPKCKYQANGNNIDQIG